MTAKPRDMERIFGLEGPLARHVEGFEPRPGQARMALLVLQALTQQETALIEAGTGTGKTLAYLVPAVMHNRRVVISTGTKTLQEQLVNKDIPSLRRAGFRFDSAVMKGRGNYLCPVRLDRFLREPLLEMASEAAYFERFRQWAAKTSTGDRAELVDFPDNLRFWDDVCSTTNHCLGGSCDFFTTCFVARMRQAAAKADLVVVNHHLYFSDLSLKRRGPAGVVPEHDAVIFDEAHSLEDVATEHFGTSMSAARPAELTRDLRSVLAAAKLSPPAVIRAARVLDEKSKLLFARLDRLSPEERGAIGSDALEALAKDHGQDVLDSLAALADELDKATLSGRTAEIEAMIRRCGELREELCVVLDAHDRENVHWVERRARGIFLHASPIEVSDILAEQWTGKDKGLVFTSATLAADGTFDFLKSRLGLRHETIEEVIPSIWDYQLQTRLYIPSDLPEPSDPGFVEGLAARLNEFLLATSGRALVLFTSYRNMTGVADRLALDLPFRILVQGRGSKGATLEEFRRDTSSVLLATASFWQGVDVVGESLSAVFIDKLPFASPGDPIISARIEASRARGDDPFWSYQVPSAILMLKQGLGRLIRGPKDRGILAIADVRLHTKYYGRKIMASLPPSPMIQDIESIKPFLSDEA